MFEQVSASKAGGLGKTRQALLLLLAIFVIGLAFACWPRKASAQTVTTTKSACLESTKGLERNARRLIDTRCKRKKAEDALKASERATKEAIRADRKTALVAIVNRSHEGPDGKTTVDQLEASSAGAKHELEMRREDRKEAVGVAKANNPSCGWLGCSQVFPLYGGHYYGWGHWSPGVNTAGGWVTPYGATHPYGAFADLRVRECAVFVFRRPADCK